MRKKMETAIWLCVSGLGLKVWWAAAVRVLKTVTPRIGEAYCPGTQWQLRSRQYLLACSYYSVAAANTAVRWEFLKTKYPRVPRVV